MENTTPQDPKQDGTDEYKPDTQKPKRALLAYEFIKAAGVKLYRDGTGRTYVRLDKKTHTDLVPCSSKEMKQAISRYCYRRHEFAPMPDDLSGITNLLDAMAAQDGELIDPALRVSKGADREFYYDLADKERRSVKITSEGWQVGQFDVIPFRRYSHTGAQVEPKKDGNPMRLFEAINLQGDERLLLACYVIACFVPDIQHPLLVLSGAKGSSKSTTMRFLKRIIDPSPLTSLSFPKDQSDLALVLSQNWAVPFDNVSALPAWLSDALCKAVTGDSFAKRQLYTDEDTVIVSYQRCIMVNGISNPSEKADLLDRVLLFTLGSIPKEQRRSEREVMAKFTDALPGILGGIFDTLARAIVLVPAVSHKDLSRMADFDIWGRAIAQALGHTEEDFIRALHGNAKRQTEEAIQGSPVALALIEWLKNNPAPQGVHASILLPALSQIAESMGISTKSKEWPKSPSAFSRRLNEIAPSLLEEGIRVTGGHRRIVVIEKIQKNAVQGVLAVPENGNDALHSILEIFGGHVIDPSKDAETT